MVIFYFLVMMEILTCIVLCINNPQLLEFLGYLLKFPRQRRLLVFILYSMLQQSDDLTWNIRVFFLILAALKSVIRVIETF
jgi:hypothetical protein